MRPALAIAAVSCLLATLLACSGKGYADPDATGDTSTAGADTDDNGGGTDAPVDETWGVGGTLTIAADVLTGSALTLQTRNPTCSVDGTVGVATPLASLVVDEVPLRLGWTVTASPDPAGGCTPSTPDTFVIGIGPTDASLGPAADKAGLNAAHAYGLYLKTGTGPLYLVGLVGTEGQLAGTEDATLEPPMVDGTYRLVTLFGVPVRP
jgi:hypothetical protein